MLWRMAWSTPRGLSIDWDVDILLEMVGGGASSAWIKSFCDWLLGDDDSWLADDVMVLSGFWMLDSELGVVPDFVLFDCRTKTINK